MKLRLASRLVCPLDKTPLELYAWEQVERPLSPAACARAEQMDLDVPGLSTEVLAGALANRARKTVYPIVRGVPRMLTFPTEVAHEFWNQYSAQLNRDLPGYSLPCEEPRPGETDVLRTFSSEWVNYGWDDRAYWGHTPEGWFRCMRYMLDLVRQPICGKTVLEVGIGIGGLANYLAENEGCELVGIDLGYAVDAAYEHFGNNPFLHIVQASAFASPFAADSFDFVYSWGVLHHTYSTREAFQTVSVLAKPKGRCYIWVYSPADERRTIARRGLMTLENLTRRWVWRLPEAAQAVVLSPLVPFYIVHQWWQSRGNGHIARYGFREAMHAARDRFTPRYVERHTEEEVCDWFVEAGYGELCRGSDRERPDYLPTALLACTGVSGVRQ